MTPRGVIFDLYGTLFIYKNMEKAFHSWHESLSLGAKELGLSTDASFIAKECESFFSFPIHYHSELTFYEERLLFLYKKIGTSPSLDWIRDFSNRSMDTWQNEIVLHPEAIPLLTDLRKANIKTAILSNFDHYPHVYRYLEETSLTSLIDVIVISSEVRLKKPDAKIFKYTLEKLQLLPSSTLMIGDDLENDIKGAQNVGLLTHFHENGASFAPIRSFFQEIL